MAGTIRCPVCGAPNPDTFERCRACNQLLDQSTSELDGFGERISSGETPTEKSTSELEKALPAWLRRARQTDQDDAEETPQEPQAEESAADAAPDPEPESEEDDLPIFPDFTDEDDDDEEIDSGDWLAGLSESAEDDDDEEESADWLKNLQGDIAPEEPEEEEPKDTSPQPLVEGDKAPAEEADLPDWMANLRDENAGDDLPDLIPSEEGSFDTENLPGEDGVPDWLSRMSEDASAETPETPAAEPASAPQEDAQPAASEAEDDLPDWMENLQAVAAVSDDDAPVSAEPTPEPEEPSQAESAAEPVDDILDWTENLQASEEAPATEEPAAKPASSDDLPDWLAGDDAPGETVPTESGDDSLEWMNNLQAEEEVAPSGEAPASPPVDDLPDWLGGDAPADEAAPAEAGDLPDWLSGAEPASEAASAEPPSSDDLPDWMSGAPAEAAPATESEAAESDLPDWMSGEADAENVFETAESEVVAASDSDVIDAGADLPDWMSNLQADDAEGDEETPEWLTGEEEESTPAAASAFEGEVDAELADELPDWMADLQAEQDEAVEAPQQAETPLAEASQQESESPLAADIPVEDDESPEWLSRMGKPTTGSLPGVDLSDDEVSPELEAADEAPEWLDSLPGIDDLEADAAGEEEKSAAPSSSPVFVDDEAPAEDDEEIFGIDMPDWLSNLAPEDLGTEAAEATADAVSAEAPDLSGAELPSWVQAMRPVESVMAGGNADDREQEIAESGPLAGLSGILPMGTSFGPKNKPQAHSLKLRVNESQQRGASLLEKIIESEGKAVSRAGADAPVSVPLLRWLIAGLMVLAVLGTLLMPQQLAPAPNIIVPEVGATLNIINELPANGTVLLVFDYEAALSAELQAAAAPVVDHIMLRGQKLALLSSTPNGPALAERFLKEIQAQKEIDGQRIYQAGSDYINLGYLPGGAAGILNFISTPRSTVIGEIAGRSFWEQPPLANITQMTDFAAVLVLTDDVEKGRTWVEQSSAALNGASIPFLMAVSAQAEPIIYPYYASGQVNGLVSGLNGGATYERLQGQTRLMDNYWDAYSVGMLTAELLIVIGAVLNFFAGLRARKKLQAEEE